MCHAGSPNTVKRSDKASRAIRVVADSNIYVSALVSGAGPDRLPIADLFPLGRIALRSKHEDEEIDYID